MADTVTYAKRTVTAIAVFSLTVFIIFVLKSYFDGDFSSVDTFKQYILGFGAWSPVILIAVQLVQVVIPLLPSAFGCAAGSMLFGAFGGFLCNYIGICAGSIIAFFIARRLGTQVVQKLVGEKNYHKYLDWIGKRKNFTLTLFLAILLPLAPDDILCFLSGLTGISCKKFIAIILIAKPWCILIYSIFFAKLF